MPQIPLSQESYSYTALPQENPQAESMADNSLAEGFGRVGQAFGMVAERARHMQQLTDAAQANSQLAMGLSDLHTQFDKDPNQVTAPQRFKDAAQGLINQTAQGISDPNVQALVIRNGNQRSISHYISLSQTSAKAVQSNAIAGIGTSVNGYIKDAAGAPNENLLGQNIDQIHGALAGGVALGMITPQQQTAGLSNAVRNIITLQGADGTQTSTAQAAATLAKYNSLLTPEDQIRVTEFLRPSMNHAQALSDVAGAGLTPAMSGGAAATAGVVGAGDNTGFLNNVGNIKAGPTAWDGKGAPFQTPSGAQFETFATPEAGVKAAVTNLRTQAAKIGPNASIGDVIKVWAPASDHNDPVGYAQMVAQSMGLTPTDRMPVNDPNTMANMVKAMTQMEKGKQPFDDSVFKTGAAAAIGNTPLPTAGGGDPDLTNANMPGMPTYQAPDFNGIENGLIAKLGDDPDRLSRALALARVAKARFESATSVQRTQLQGQIANTTKALTDGRDVPIPETHIRAIYQPDQANTIIEQLQEAQGYGQVRKQVASASAADLITWRARLADGVGPVDPVPKAGSAAGAPPGLQGTSADLTDYKKRAQQLAWFDKAVADREASLNADPAGYVLRTSPDLAAARQAIDPQNPASFADFDAQMRAEQTRLGVADAKQHALSQDQATAATQQLTAADPSKSDPGANMTAMANQYGPAWPHVFADLVKLGKLPPEYQMLGMMDAPGQGPARQDLTRVIQATSQKGGMQGLERDAGTANVRQVDTLLDTQMESFQRTAMVPGINGGIEQTAMVRDSMRKLALFYSAQGVDPATAVQRAADGMLNQKYDFGYDLGSSAQAAMRVPKGMWNQVDQATSGMIAKLQPGDLAPVSTTGNADIDAQRQADALRTVKKSIQWVTSQDDGGVVAYARNPVTNAPIRVLGADGKQLEIRFKGLQVDAPPLSPGQQLQVVP